MNRLLAKKKTKDGVLNDENAPPDNIPAVSAPAQQQKKKGWRRRKGKQEPEPEIDLRTVLPSADNFRTSLILPNLSTRFSMLKEQDDPNSLLGKASDDSVLSHKRRSRLADFGHHSPGLSDIAEVSSFTSSANFRPGLTVHRQGSYNFGEGYATDDESTYSGSIMSRARPGEGNMLFGGRQKIYRIPIGDSGSVSNLGNGEHRGMRGRALYEDDVSMSAFQRLREEERERLRLEKEMELDGTDLNSPALSYNEKRETVSSTNSGPSMVGGSTAPTSVAASSPGLPSSTSTQPPFVPPVEKSKSRKLYEQGLDQHMQEQQSAAITRLTSLKRNTSVNGGPSGPYRARSASNIHDRYETGSSASVRTASPLPIAENRVPSDSSQHRPSLDHASPQARSAGQDDLESEKQAALWQSLDPIDRGMATAMGTFNRPKKFDEEQFLQRQMSLLKQQPRKTSEAGSTKSNSSSSPTSSRKVNGDGRPRACTAGTDASWSESSIKEEETIFTESHSTTVKETAPESPLSQQTPDSTSRGTFFAADDADDAYDESDDVSPEQSRSQNTASSQSPPVRSIPPPILTHPAMRPSPSQSPQRNKEKRRAWSPDELQSGLAAQGGPHKEYLALQGNAASQSTPELPSSSGSNQNIHGLVREHLRHPSNSSSIYPLRTPGPEQTEFGLGIPSMYDIPSPWDGDDGENEEEKGLNNSEYTFGSSGIDKSQTVEAPLPDRVAEVRENGADWQRELSKQHARGGSSETAHERQAFASELADRQRTIQQNLKIKAEQGNSGQTNSNARNVFESGLKQFGMLRQKPSDSSLQITERELPRPSFSSNDRSYSKSRLNRDGTMSPPIIGRTLHSKMPRASEDEFYGPQAEYMRMARPSAEYRRPSHEAARARVGSNATAPARGPPSRTSPVESSRTSSSKARSSSETSANGSPVRAGFRHRNGSLARPSLDTTRAVQDGENRQSPVSASSSDRRNPRAERSRMNTLTQITTDSPRTSLADNTGSAPYSTNSTPPLSASSTTNFASSAASASASTNTQASAGYPEKEVPQTGFFFPPLNSAGANSESKSDSRETSTSRQTAPRKNTISKVDISEPTLINSTSAVSTVDLPAGASLQNGLRDDFDVVLMGGSSTAPAPSPTIPTGDKPRKGGFLSSFGRRDNSDRDKMMQSAEDEPEPRRFRIRRLEAEDRYGAGKPMHRAYHAPENGSVDGLQGGMF